MRRLVRTWLLAAAGLVASPIATTDAGAQDFSRGAWVRGCQDTTGQGRYVVVCDGYGGALFDARRPADCDFGSRFACRTTTLCALSRVMTIRDWSGAALSQADLGCSVGGVAGPAAAEPEDPHAQCVGEAYEALCRRCLAEERGDLVICQRYL